MLLAFVLLPVTRAFHEYDNCIRACSVATTPCLEVADRPIASALQHVMEPTKFVVRLLVTLLERVVPLQRMSARVFARELSGAATQNERSARKPVARWGMLV